MNTPKVSVVIPTFNYGHFVVDAVESALAQTFTDREIIVVDDGSVDDTQSRLAPYADRIRYVYQENRGLSAARNRGIAEARGTFVGFLDSDDQWHSRFLEIIMRSFDREPGFSLLGSGSVSGPTCCWEGVNDEKMSLSEVPVEAFVTTHPIVPSAVVIRKQAFEAVGTFDVNLRSVEDRDMWIRIALAFRAGYVDARLGWSRRHGSSMSAAANTARMEHFDRLVLERAFQHPKLHRRIGLKRQAFSLADWRNTVGYRDAGAMAQAWWCLARACANWPFPYQFGMNRLSMRARLRYIAQSIRLQAMAASRIGRWKPQSREQNPASGTSAMDPNPL